MGGVRAAFQLVAAALLVAGCQTTERAPLEPASLAVTNVTVIDPESRRVLPAHSVYIRGDRIVAVRPSAGPQGYAAERTIDGTGQYLIPGLMDMHVHLFLPQPAPATLNLLLANGVTGIREMSGDCWALAGATKGCIGEYRALQNALRSGETPGPDIVAIAGTMVMGPANVKLPDGVPPIVVPGTPDQGRELARHLHGRGVDIVKTHDSVPHNVFVALIEEARRLGLEVSGHVPFGAGSLGAATLGYRSIEHARDLLYDCSRYGAEFRRTNGDFVERKPGSARPPNLVRLARTVDEYDPALCASFLAQLSATGVYHTPTHVTREMEARAGDAAYRSDPARRYILAPRAADWEKDLTSTAALPAEEMRQLGRFYRHGLLITGLAHRAGLPIMAGTDANDTMIVPGFSLHRELGLLREAGLSPMDVLRAATSVPAAYLRKSDRYGGIAAGKEADLVLLGADPLKDVANMRQVRAVVANGRLYDRAALDALLADVERMAARPAL